MEMPQRATLTQPDFAPEIERAILAIETPEVQELVRQLARHNLAVCIPHMHLPEQDFAVLPPDMVQIEQGCKVDWVSRQEAASFENAVPVAWRWIDDGVQSTMACWISCIKGISGRHQRDHIR